MSASIKYRPVKGGKDVPTMMPSRLIDALEQAFGKLPVQLGAGDLPVLRGMAAVSDDKAYPALIEAVERLGEIEVYAVY